MPDVFAPVTVLALFLLAFGPVRLRVVVGAVAVLGIAVHLSHLVVAVGCVLAAACLGNWRGAGRAALPLAMAVALLVVSVIALSRSPLVHDEHETGGSYSPTEPSASSATTSR